MKREDTLAEGATDISMLPINAKSGFTLAEVLITLGIIGIVAAMTIPALMENVRDVQFRSKFFKSYALIQQTLKRMEADDVPLVPTGYDRTNDPLYKKFSKYHSNITDCGDTLGSKHGQGCFELGSENYFALVGTSKIDKQYFDDGQLLMPDGSIIFFEQPNIGTKDQRTWIWVDVNGKKLPNRMGHDLFCFQLTDDGLKAMGVPGTTYDEDTYCKKTSGGNMNGIACASKVLKDPKYFKWLKQYGN